MQNFSAIMYHVRVCCLIGSDSVLTLQFILLRNQR